MTAVTPADLSPGIEPAPSPDASPARRISLPLLCTLACGLGIVTGLGAVLFRDLIGFLHNLLFLGLPQVGYDANLFTPLHWGAGIILVPVIGAVIVTFLVSNFAPEARGHGVPEVMDSIYYNDGRIRPVVAVVKSLASAVAIGSGAAVGREGPIIQIGSAIGSTIGQIIAMTPGQRITLVAAGAGAGIASTFNTPIGGVLFAIELMMPEVSVTTFLPTAIATGTATFVGRLFFGSQPAFHVPAVTPLPVDATTALALVLYAILGVLCGVAATGFIRGLHLLEDAFDHIENRYLRHIAGMLMVGVLIYLLARFYGHYFVEGVGYSTIQSILLGQMTPAPLLLMLFVAKMFATSVSLGSGSSGGIFSPSLFMGATLGAGFAALVALLPLPMPIDIPSFALVGMGAMVGGGTGAVMTAVAMIFEMTRDYDIVAPMIVAVAFAVGVRRLLSRENIYTIKLVRRGHVVPKALHANMFLVRLAAQVMDKDFVLAPSEGSFDAFLRDEEHQGRMRHLLVTSGDRIVGVQRVNTSLRRGLEDLDTGVKLGEIANRRFVLAGEGDIVFDVIRRMWQADAFMALVVRKNGTARAGDVLGVITKEHVADSVAASIALYPD
ncbi:MAG: chloride channel protein [Alphaproteobacteria bacterium]|nr:chloride channel protein [Alphaproteobacteria bacterium]